MDPNRVQLLRIFPMETQATHPDPTIKKNQALAWKGHAPQQSSLPFRHLGRLAGKVGKVGGNFANPPQKS